MQGEERVCTASPPARLKCGNHLFVLSVKAKTVWDPDVNEGKLWLFFMVVVWLEGEDAG